MGTGKLKVEAGHIDSLIRKQKEMNDPFELIVFYLAKNPSPKMVLFPLRVGIPYLC